MKADTIQHPQKTAAELQDLTQEKLEKWIIKFYKVFTIQYSQVNDSVVSVIVLQFLKY